MDARHWCGPKKCRGNSVPRVTGLEEGTGVLPRLEPTAARTCRNLGRATSNVHHARSATPPTLVVFQGVLRFTADGVRHLRPPQWAGFESAWMFIGIRPPAETMYP